MALQVKSGLLAGGAVGEWDVVVCNVVEEVNLLFLEHQTSCDRVDWCVAPTLVEESTIAVQVVEVVDVGLAAEPVEITDFEVGPLFAD